MLAHARSFRGWIKARAQRFAGALMSLNDPQWGKRPGREGPPDLDELWRNFNRKLDGLFGRRGGGDGDKPPSAGRRFGGAGLLLSLIVAVWLVSGFYIVYEGQRGVVLRFGKFKEVTMPGPR